MNEAFFDLQEAAIRFALRAQSSMLSSAKSIALCSGEPAHPRPVDPRVQSRLRDRRASNVSASPYDLVFDEPDAFVGVKFDPALLPRRQIEVTLWITVHTHANRQFSSATVPLRYTGSAWQPVAPVTKWSSNWDDLLYGGIAVVACPLPKYLFDLCWPRAGEILALEDDVPAIYRSDLHTRRVQPVTPISPPNGCEVDWNQNPITFSPTGKRATLIVRTPHGSDEETFTRLFVDCLTGATSIHTFSYPRDCWAQICWFGDDSLVHLVASNTQPFLEIYSVTDGKIVGHIPVKGKPKQGRIAYLPARRQIGIYSDEGPMFQTIDLPAGSASSDGTASAVTVRELSNFGPKYAQHNYSRFSSNGEHALHVFEPSLCVPYLRIFCIWITAWQDAAPREACQIAVQQGAYSVLPPLCCWSPDDHQIGFALGNTFWILNQNFG